MKVNGRFYFKKTSNGNLIGEWSSHQSNGEVLTESGDLKCGNLDLSEAAQGKTCSEYQTTWRENGEAAFAKLEISRNNLLFTLKWTNITIGGQTKQHTFTGEGMLADGIVIGDYRQT